MWTPCVQLFDPGCPILAWEGQQVRVGQDWGGMGQRQPEREQFHKTNNSCLSHYCFVYFITPLSGIILLISCLLVYYLSSLFKYTHACRGTLDLLGTQLWRYCLFGLRPSNTEIGKQTSVPPPRSRARPDTSELSHGKCMPEINLNKDIYLANNYIVLPICQVQFQAFHKY